MEISFAQLAFIKSMHQPEISSLPDPKDQHSYNLFFFFLYYNSKATIIAGK